MRNTVRLPPVDLKAKLTTVVCRECIYLAPLSLLSGRLRTLSFFGMPLFDTRYDSNWAALLLELWDTSQLEELTLEVYIRGTFMIRDADAIDWARIERAVAPAMAPSLSCLRVALVGYKAGDRFAELELEELKCNIRALLPWAVARSILVLIIL